MKKVYVFLTVFVSVLVAASICIFVSTCRKVVLIENPQLLELLSNYAEQNNYRRYSFASSNTKHCTVSAVVTLSNRFNFENSSDSFSSNQLIYPLSDLRELYIPAIESDFSISNDKQKSVTDPELDIQLCAIDDIPQKFRALPVNKKYAGDEEYALTKNAYAVVTVCSESQRKKLKELFDDVFSGEEKNVKKINFVTGAGDLMVSRGVQEILINPEQGPEMVFTDTLPILKNNDITIGNLEGPVTEHDEKWFKTYTFKFNKQVLKPLKDAGFNYFMFTNNHCYDYGEKGFRDTLEALKEYDCPTSGVGLNIDEAKKFYHTTVNGQEFSIISIGAFPVEVTGFNGLTMASATDTRPGMLWQNDEILSDIQAEKASGKTVIVNIHGGREYYLTPVEEQRSYYEKLVDSGAAVVFGSHPHVIQPSEWYKDGFIVYSLGNFVFNGMDDMPNATDTEIVRLGFYGNKIIYAEQYPCKIDGTAVRRKY